MNLLKEATSIGIIGGADGPTVVFVTGNPTAVILAAVGVAAAVALLITGIVMYIKKR